MIHLVRLLERGEEAPLNAAAAEGELGGALPAATHVKGGAADDPRVGCRSRRRRPRPSCLKGVLVHSGDAWRTPLFEKDTSIDEKFVFDGEQNTRIDEKIDIDGEHRLSERVSQALGM